jgi:hypothetical protein
MTTVSVSESNVQNLCLHNYNLFCSFITEPCQLFLYIEICPPKISDKNFYFMSIIFHMGGEDETFCSVSQIRGTSVFNIYNLGEHYLPLCQCPKIHKLISSLLEHTRSARQKEYEFIYNASI